jgi:hypothetical protein
VPTVERWGLRALVRRAGGAEPGLVLGRGGGLPKAEAPASTPRPGGGGGPEAQTPGLDLRALVLRAGGSSSSCPKGGARFTHTGSTYGVKNLHPNYIAGFIDGEGSFNMTVSKDESRSALLRSGIFKLPPPS